VYVDELRTDDTGPYAQDCLSLTAPAARRLATALIEAAGQIDRWAENRTEASTV
jgi:hypothetical protein